MKEEPAEVDRSPDAPNFWEIQKAMISRYEEDLIFDKDGIVSLFKRLNTEPKYRVLTVDRDGEENYKASVADRGTFLDGKVPCFKIELYFRAS